MEPLEEQVAAYLGTFQLPDETVAAIIDMYERAADERDDSERPRRDITNRLEHITELYKWGDGVAAIVAQPDFAPLFVALTPVCNAATESPSLPSLQSQAPHQSP